MIIIIIIIIITIIILIGIIVGWDSFALDGRMERSCADWA